MLGLEIRPASNVNLENKSFFIYLLINFNGRAIAQAASLRFPTSAARARAQVRSCGIFGGQNALEQVFSEYFGFLCQFSLHWLLHTHNLSSVAGTIGQLVANVPSGLSLTPPQETERKAFNDSDTSPAYIASNDGEKWTGIYGKNLSWSSMKWNPYTFLQGLGKPM
jgi:hypothetical protein